MDYESCSQIDDLSGCITTAGYRLPVFLASIYLPLVSFMIEFGFNRLEMTFQHVLYPLIIVGLYLICTMFS